MPYTLVSEYYNFQKYLTRSAFPTLKKEMEEDYTDHIKLN